MMWSGSWGWWGPGVLFLVVCTVMMVRMMGHGHRSHTGGLHGYRPSRAERILAERLARGEIDVDDYERRLAVLQRTSGLDRT
jgi:putative membrane protein